MSTRIRILVGVPGVLMLVNALQWLFAPAAAAEGLGMPLLDGLARSSQMGDTGGFFLSAAVMILLGAFRAEAAWLHGGALLLGGAAFYRTAAWLAHGAELAALFIVAEVVMAGILVFGASRARAVP